MKKSLLTLLMMLTIISLSKAQTTYVDFETNTNPTGYVFGGNGYEPGVANPDNTGNTSATVGKVTTGNETWSGMAMPIGGTVDFSNSATTFTMDVYSDVTGAVLFKLENATNTSQAVELSIDYTTANAWQTLSFNLGDTLDAGLYSQIVLFFNFGTTNATTWYFDNIVGPNATFGSNVNVNLKIDDKLEVASSVGLTIEGEDISLTKGGNLYTAQKTLAPYTIENGGGDYEAIIKLDGANYDTTTITVSGGSATMDWNYIILKEEPEDGTALAISVGSKPPVIDGQIDNVWNNARVHPLQQRTWWGSATGLYSYYKIMWDIDNLYILNYVDDNTPKNDGDPVYENDNVEIFFDMNQSSSSSFDADDWQIRAVRGKDTWTGSSNTESANWSTAQRAQTNLPNNSGYIVEWAIPWTTLSSAFLPLVTTKFNFDVVVADVADGAGRDYIIAWNTYLDQNYNNTTLYGTITLSDQTKEITGIQNVNMVDFTVYPNPANGYIKLTSENIINDVKVIDIAGKVLLNNYGVSNTKVEINTNELPGGIYFIHVNDNTGNSSTKRIVIVR